jgi:hypothetical protein
MYNLQKLSKFRPPCSMHRWPHKIQGIQIVIILRFLSIISQTKRFWALIKSLILIFEYRISPENLWVEFWHTLYKFIRRNIGRNQR